MTCSESGCGRAWTPNKHGGLFHLGPKTLLWLWHFGGSLSSSWHCVLHVKLVCGWTAWDSSRFHTVDGNFHFLQALLLFARVHLLPVASCPPSVTVYFWTRPPSFLLSLFICLPFSSFSLLLWSFHFKSNPCFLSTPSPTLCPYLAPR